MNILASVNHFLASTFFVVVTTMSSVFPLQATNMPHQQSSPNQQELNKSTSESPTSSQKISQTTTTNSPSSTPTPTINRIITAKSTIASNGKTIYLTLTYPSGGGDILGSIGGDCSGNIDGVYDGPTTGSLTGSAKATCPIGFVAAPVSITYFGKMISDTRATISYTITALGQNQSDKTTLVLVQ